MASIVKKKMIKYFPLLQGILLLLLLPKIYCCEVDQELKALSSNERCCMRIFFDSATKEDNVGHTLFCDTKPVALTSILLKCPCRPYRYILKQRGWQAFKKHEKLFPHPNFIISESIEKRGNSLVQHIYFINKKILKQCVADNLTFLKRKLGESFSYDEFIDDLERGISLPSLIHKDPEVLGVLLGYGQDASSAFVVARKKEGLAEKKYELLVGQKPRRCTISPICMMGDPHLSETAKLFKGYDQELTRIWNMYSNSKNRLKMALHYLCLS